MTPKQQRELVRHWYEDVLSGTVAEGSHMTGRGADSADLGLSHLFAPDYVNHVVPCPPGGWKTGVEGAWQIIKAFRRSLPDLTVDIEEQIVADDKVVTRYTATGTATAKSFFGQEANGQRYTVIGVGIEQVGGGRIVASWGTWDAYGLMEQMGLLPQVAHLDA